MFGDANMDQKLLMVALHVEFLEAKDIVAAWPSVFNGDSTMYWAVYERFLRLKKLCGSGGETEKSRKFNKARGKKGCGKKFGKAKTRPQEDDSCPPDSEFERYGDE